MVLVLINYNNASYNLYVNQTQINMTREEMHKQKPVQVIPAQFTLKSCYSRRNTVKKCPSVLSKHFPPHSDDID